MTSMINDTLFLMNEQNNQIKIVLIILRSIQVINGLIVVGFFAYLAIEIRDIDIPKKSVIETNLLVVLVDLLLSSLSAIAFVVVLSFQHLAFGWDAMTAVSLCQAGVTITGHVEATKDEVDLDESTVQKGVHFMLQVCCLLTFCTSFLWLVTAILNWRLVLIERKEIWNYLLKRNESKENQSNAK